MSATNRELALTHVTFLTKWDVLVEVDKKVCNRALHLVLGSERLVYLYYRRAIANPRR